MSTALQVHALEQRARETAAMAAVAAIGLTPEAGALPVKIAASPLQRAEMPPGCNAWRIATEHAGSDHLLGVVAEIFLQHELARRGLVRLRFDPAVGGGRIGVADLTPDGQLVAMWFEFGEWSKCARSCE